MFLVQQLNRYRYSTDNRLISHYQMESREAGAGREFSE